MTSGQLWRLGAAEGRFGRLSNGRRELLYVCETRRKEGKPPPFYRYRRTAILRIEDRRSSLVGTYYTEQGGSGTVSFTRSA